MRPFAVRPVASIGLPPIQKLLTTIGLILVPWCASAVAAQPRFDIWTTENGLPQNSVNDIVQTRDGYLWLATFGGLVRFDGVRFVVFDRSVAGIGSQRVRALHEDRRGTLWAATEDGMLIRYRDGRFVTYGSEDGLPQTTAVRIEEDDAGDLWITWLGMITRFDGKRAQNFGPDRFGNRVAAPPDDRYINVWWSRDAEGFHALVGGRVRTYAIDKELNGEAVNYVLPDRCGNLWITTSGAGLIKASADRIQRYTPRDGLPVSRRDGVFLGDCHDNVWFEDSRWTVYRVSQRRPERIDVPPVLAIYGDREGSVWLGTSSGGLRRMRESSIATLTERDGLANDNVYSILEDRTGVMWIGTWGGGLTRYAGGRSTSYGTAQGLASGRISCLYEDRSGTLWVGTDRGLSYRSRDEFRRYEDPGGLLTGNVWAMHEDRSGAVWFATDNGLVRSAGGHFTRFTTQDGLPHDRTSALLEDRTGALWIGTFQGLTRLKGGVFAAYYERGGFVGNWVRAIHEDREGILWIGTYDGGLYRLAGERLTRYTRNEGLHDNGIFQILEDDEGNLWTGSNRGISRISRRELNEVAAGLRRSITPTVFGVRDGLGSVEVNGGRQPAGVRTRDGKLWFPTMGGAAVIDPRALRIAAEPPAAIIEEFRLAGTPVDFAGEVRIPPDAAAFEIRYTAPSFIKPEQVRFRYRLGGPDGEWIDAGDRRSVSFFRIPSGHYRFEVIAASHDGQWSAAGPFVDILVLTPFWRSAWFMGLAAAGVGAIAFTGHLMRMRRLRRLHDLQESFSRQLIDFQEGERQRISKEMHDSLGQDVSIIKKVARARQQRAGNRDRLEEALEEIGAVAERIDAQMKEIAYDLRPHQLDTIGLSKTIESMVRRVGRACDVEFVTRIDPIDGIFPQHSHIHIFRIVQEAVSNIVRHSRASHAKAIVAIGAGCVEIRVEDDGGGFSDEPNDGSSPATHGFGLAGMQERARILGGRVEILSSAGTGTVVVVTLPFEAAALA